MYAEASFLMTFAMGGVPHAGSRQARVKVDILGSSELKWTGMGEFNSDDHYIYYCGQESLRRHGVEFSQQKSPILCTP